MKDGIGANLPLPGPRSKRVNPHAYRQRLANEFMQLTTSDEPQADQAQWPWMDGPPKTR